MNINCVFRGTVCVSFVMT